MRIAIVGAGAVGGYFGARLAHAGRDVTFIARRAHLDAIRAGASRWSARCWGTSPPAPAPSPTRPRSGQWTWCCSRSRLTTTPRRFPQLAPLVGRRTAVLTLQNGIDSTAQLAAALGEACVLGGTTYVATAIEAPGPHRPDRRASFDHLRRSVRRASRSLGAGPRDRGGAGARRHRGGGGARRPGADLGQVRLPGAVLGLDRRRPAAHRSAVAPGRTSGRRSMPRPGKWRRIAAAEGVTHLGGSLRHPRSLHEQHPAGHALVAAHRPRAGQAHRGRGAAGRSGAPRGQRSACRCRSSRRCMRC